MPFASMAATSRTCVCPRWSMCARRSRRKSWRNSRRHSRSARILLPLLIRIPKAGDISGTERRTIGTYGAFAHAQGTSSRAVDDRSQSLCEETIRIRSEQILKAAGVEPGDLWLLAVRKARARSRACNSSARPADSCGSIWRKNMRPSTERLTRPAIPRKISASSGSPISPCSSGTSEKRWNAAHHPFTSLHDEDMAKLETSYRHDAAIPSRRWERFARWLMTWC